MSDILSNNPNEFLILLDAAIVGSVESDAVYVPTYREFTFQSFGTGGSSAVIQASIETEPANWVTIGTTLAAAGSLVKLSGLFVWLRVVKDAGTDPLTVMLRRGLIGGSAF